MYTYKLHRHVDRQTDGHGAIPSRPGHDEGSINMNVRAKRLPKCNLKWSALAIDHALGVPFGRHRAA